MWLIIEKTGDKSLNINQDSENLKVKKKINLLSNWIILLSLIICKFDFFYPMNKKKVKQNVNTQIRTFRTQCKIGSARSVYPFCPYFSAKRIKGLGHHPLIRVSCPTLFSLRVFVGTNIFIYFCIFRSKRHRACGLSLSLPHFFAG